MRLHPRMHYAAQAGCLGLFLAIGSAWIGPKFTRASYQSKDAVLCEALRYLRAEIQVYQTEHSNSTPRTGQALLEAQRGHRKPSGQRNRAKYSRQAVSVEKRASNSSKSCG